MPVDPRELEGFTGLDKTVILSDRPCTGCGYNLKGLPVEGKCPECGRSIRSRKTPVRSDEDMVAAPVPWLSVFALGATLMLFSGCVLIVFMVVRVFYYAPIMALIAAAASIAWVCGTWLVSRPRPRTSSGPINTAREWAVLRWISRLCQPAVMVWAFFNVMEAGEWAVAVPTGVDVVEVSIVCGMLVWCIGLGALCVLLSRIAEWGADTNLAFGLRTQMMLVSVAGVFSPVPVVEIIRTIGTAPGLGFAILAVYFVIVLSPLVWGLVCLWRLYSLGYWTFKNHRQKERRDERFREKARAEREQQRQQVARL